MYNAHEVYINFKIYKQYLSDNNLPDDSNQISVKQLMNFCKHHIDEYHYLKLANND